MHLNPAKSIIATCGGFEAVAQITGKSISRVYRWTYPKERGGTGGIIPTRDARKLLAYANREGIDLSPSVFLADPRPAPRKQRVAA